MHYNLSSDELFAAIDDLIAFYTPCDRYGKPCSVVDIANYGARVHASVHVDDRFDHRLAQGVHHSRGIRVLRAEGATYREALQNVLDQLLAAAPSFEIIAKGA